MIWTEATGAHAHSRSVHVALVSRPAAFSRLAAMLGRGGRSSVSRAPRPVPAGPPTPSGEGRPGHPPRRPPLCAQTGGCGAAGAPVRTSRAVPASAGARSPCPILAYHLRPQRPESVGPRSGQRLSVTPRDFRRADGPAAHAPGAHTITLDGPSSPRCAATCCWPAHARRAHLRRRPTRTSSTNGVGRFLQARPTSAPPSSRCPASSDARRISPARSSARWAPRRRAHRPRNTMGPTSTLATQARAGGGRPGSARSAERAAGDDRPAGPRLRLPVRRLQRRGRPPAVQAAGVRRRSGPAGVAARDGRPGRFHPAAGREVIGGESLAGLRRRRPESRRRQP